MASNIAVFYGVDRLFKCKKRFVNRLPHLNGISPGGENDMTLKVF